MSIRVACDKATWHPTADDSFAYFGPRTHRPRLLSRTQRGYAAGRTPA